MKDPFVKATVVIYPGRGIDSAWWVGLMVGHFVCKYGTAYKDSVDAYGAAVSMFGVKPVVMPKGAVGK